MRLILIGCGLLVLVGCASIADRMDASGGLRVMRTAGGAGQRLDDADFAKVQLLVVDIPRLDDPERRVLALAVRNSGAGIARFVPRLTLYSRDPEPGQCETFDPDWDWAFALKPGRSTIVPLSYYNRSEDDQAASAAAALAPIALPDGSASKDAARQEARPQYVGLLVVLAEPANAACPARVVWSRNPLSAPQQSDSWSYLAGEIVEH